MMKRKTPPAMISLSRPVVILFCWLFLSSSSSSSNTKQSLSACLVVGAFDLNAVMFANMDNASLTIAATDQNDTTNVDGVPSYDRNSVVIVPAQLPQCSLNCTNGGICSYVSDDWNVLEMEFQRGALIQKCTCSQGYTGMACEITVGASNDASSTTTVTAKAATTTTAYINNVGSDTVVDCSVAWSVSPFAGSMCTSPYTEYCSTTLHVNDEYDGKTSLLVASTETKSPATSAPKASSTETIQFCTNGGKCISDIIGAKVDPRNTSVNAEYVNAGCACPMEFHGPHCEFLNYPSDNVNGLVQGGEDEPVVSAAGVKENSVALSDLLQYYFHSNSNNGNDQKNKILTTGDERLDKLLLASSPGSLTARTVPTSTDSSNVTSTNGSDDTTGSTTTSSILIIGAIVSVTAITIGAMFTGFQRYHRNVLVSRMNSSTTFITSGKGMSFVDNVFDRNHNNDGIDDDDVTCKSITPSRTRTTALYLDSLEEQQRNMSGTNIDFTDTYDDDRTCKSMTPSRTRTTNMYFDPLDQPNVTTTSSKSSSISCEGVDNNNNGRKDQPKVTSSTQNVKTTESINPFLFYDALVDDDDIEVANVSNANRTITFDDNNKDDDEENTHHRRNGDDSARMENSNTNSRRSCSSSGTSRRTISSTSWSSILFPNNSYLENWNDTLAYAGIGSSGSGSGSGSATVDVADNTPAALATGSIGNVKTGIDLLIGSSSHDAHRPCREGIQGTDGNTKTTSTSTTNVTTCSSTSTRSSLARIDDDKDQNENKNEKKNDFHENASQHATINPFLFYGALEDDDIEGDKNGTTVMPDTTATTCTGTSPMFDEYHNECFPHHYDDSGRRSTSSRLSSSSSIRTISSTSWSSILFPFNSALDQWNNDSGNKPSDISAVATIGIPTIETLRTIDDGCGTDPDRAIQQQNGISANTGPTSVPCSTNAMNTRTSLPIETNNVHINAINDNTKGNVKTNMTRPLSKLRLPAHYDKSQSSMTIADTTAISNKLSNNKNNATLQTRPQRGNCSSIGQNGSQTKTTFTLDSSSQALRSGRKSGIQEPSSSITTRTRMQSKDAGKDAGTDSGKDAGTDSGIGYTRNCPSISTGFIGI